jgi:hypothetical protein
VRAEEGGRVEVVEGKVAVGDGVERVARGRARRRGERQGGARGPDELVVDEPVLVDRFLAGATELDVDVLCTPGTRPA